MSTVNNRNKKYWVRYNSYADRLETAITDGGKKPQGRGWISLDINKCCAEVGGYIITEELSFSEGCSNTASLEINDLTIGDGAEQINGNPEDEGGIIDQLNDEYEGIATFTYNPDTNIITVHVLAGNFGDFTFVSASDCE
jgi:hypothetical protein